MTANSEIAVVVVSYNTRDLLLECLTSVVDSATGNAIELIVIDNASTDGSVEAIHRSFPESTIIANRSNRGFAAACNQGIQATGAAFVLLLNSDARLTQSALTALRDCMSEERCGAAGCRLVDATGVEQVSTMNFLTPFNQALELAGVSKGLGWRSLRRTCRPKTGGSARDCSVDWIEASCLLVRRTALDEVGLFDERFFMYSEDEDLCLRLRKNGWLVCFTDAGTAVHRGGASAELSRAENLVHFYLSQMRFLLKHRSRAAVKLYTAANWASLTLKRIFSNLKGRKQRVEELSLRLVALKEASRLVVDCRLMINH